VDSRILDAVREDQRYVYEAYDFVCQAVNYTQGRLGRDREKPISDEARSGTAKAKPKSCEADNHYHITAAELLRGTCELAIKEFGMMAPIVFQKWGVRTTEDIGQIVFRLIRCERLSQSDRDDPDDFVDVFDLDRELTEGFSMSKSPRPGRKVSER
jgi:uncharacterized repeat protein (TIGR04138 family)